ncbi:MAG TPA: UDP-N-acetylmuramoyl-L-alanine--D-glutamate ligase [Campylobacterales bacterium]|nr:UDP-N-acetylmuramoyl-L-alanine--D-glutamate ligase [Campylobacterales bacterium]
MTLFGYGVTNKAIAKKFGNCKIYDDSFNGVIYDKNGNEFLESEMFNPDKSDFEVTSPGIPPSNPLIKKAKNLISEYDLFADTMPFSIWITGTNGKTTTTAMIEYLLEKRGGVAGGNIGTPLANLDEKANIWILETSSFTLHYTSKAKPNLYIVLPISDDHTDWHGGFKEYEEAKLKPIKTMLEGEIVILPSKYKNLETNATKVLYENSQDLAKYFDIDIKKVRFSEPFLTDALLALASSKILFDEVDYKKINSFIVGEHRVEKFKDRQKRTWINDSKATNSDATLAALNGLKEKEVFLILGGDDKGADLEPLFQKLTLNIKIFTIGTNSQKLGLLAKKYNIRCLSCENIENAIKQISIEFLSCQNQVALLSPAAASFDQFKSYAHRGDEFKRIVGNLS